jgi:soluble lytic murein transglycosylase-like protein
MHSRRSGIARTAAAALAQLKKRSVALAVGVPLTFFALGFPSEAMNVTLPALPYPIAIATASPKTTSFPIFTTQKIRESFMAPQPVVPPKLTLDVMKEEFFRSEIPYGSIIFREAQRNNLSPELVAAVVESESDFQANLVSEKNAQGLMQIVPETGRLLGCDNPFNPSQNIAAGTKYLRYLMDRFGNERMALAAYNAGEGNVERFGGIPPFQETTDYLQRVSHRTKSYRQRVNNRWLAAVRMRGTVLQ